MKKSSIFRLFVLLALAVVIGASLIFLPVKDELERFLRWVEALGPWGPVVVAAAYVPATVLFVPGTILTLGAGSLFGVVQGTIAISIGSTLGASAAFLVGRTLLRGWIEERVSRNPKFQAIDQAVGEQGFKIVLLLRLSPVFPFNLLNYALSLTKVSFRDYFFASWIGMFPGTVMYVYLGSTLKDLADVLAGRVERTIAQQVLYYVGLFVTVVVTVYVTRVARKALKQAIPNVETEQKAVPQGVAHD